MVLDTARKVEDKSQQLEDKAKASPKAKETTPLAKEPSPKTYTQAELDKAKEDAVHDALMTRGRDWKTLELERDSLSKQLAEQKYTTNKLNNQID